MSHRMIQGIGNRILYAGLLAAWCGLAPAAWCVESPAETISAHLSAGEFGPALRLAQGLENAQQRDQWLGQIATAQAQLGARDASLSTLLDVQSDLARSALAREMGGRPIGAGGGAALADFDTLIELITTTIAPDSWDDVGGAGAIEPFPTGVYVDGSGVLKRLAPARASRLLRQQREAALADSGNRNVRLNSTLRKVSLVRLERELQLRQAFGQSADDVMRQLAGIYRVKYVFVYPETGDLVLAGPAGDWNTDAEGRIVNCQTRTPVLQLDDLVTVLRNAYQHAGKLGCAIKPRQENLAQAKAYVDAWAGKSLRPGQRDRWLAGLRDALGKQDIEVWGIDPGCRVARIIVEADYHMKLVGMGLEEGTLGVTSYLDTLKETAGDRALPMDVLRWWFTLNYEGVRTNGDRNVYQLDGPGVRVLSENEMLTERGERIHTGSSNLLNLQFAQSFTRHFDDLAVRYPVYAELRNVFDLALVSAMVQAEDLPGQIGWHLTQFGPRGDYQVPTGPVAREVESIINCVDVNKQRFLVGVSGGVSIDTHSLIEQHPIQVDDYGVLDAAHGTALPDPQQLPRDAWWWD